MKKILTNECFILIIFIVVCIIATILFSNWRKNECIKKNGKVVENSLGIMEKCIIGEDK